jgi:hypothetical protein
LSLNAPVVCVSSSGTRRRARSNSICLLILQSAFVNERSFRIRIGAADVNALL